MNPLHTALVWLASASALTASSAAAPPPVDTVDIVDAVEQEHLAMEQERYRRMTVPVTVEGEGPFRFMIDTGAEATVLSNALADRLGKTERRNAFLIGMASRRSVEVVSLDSIELGSRSFAIETAPLVRQEHIGGADGILGLDSLQNQRVLLDFEAQTISVADAETLGGNRGYEIVVKARREFGQLIITQAMVDNIRVAVVIDTGAQTSVGNLMLQKKLRRAHVGTSQMTDVNGVVLEGDVKIARNLRIGRVELSNVPVTFADSPTFKALKLHDRPAMVLGMRELKLFKRVAIDFESKRVLFDLPRKTGWVSSLAGSR